MKLNINQAIEAIMRGETPEQYKARIQKLRKLGIERDFLIEGIEILEGDERAEKKKKRLEKVLRMIEELK